MTDFGSHDTELLRNIVARATTDTTFRKRLLGDPAGAIYDAFGVHVPPGYRIRFIEKEAGLDALVVLPDLPPKRGELDDDDLDAVAGGAGDCCGGTATW